jgi:hypothetical protein
MANIRGSNQTPIVTQRYLNTSTYAGDPTPGAVVSTSSVSGSIIQSYGGFVGGILTLGGAAASYYSDLVNGQQLYPGDYQYVQFDPSAVLSAAVQGQIVYWKQASQTTPISHIVVIDQSAAAQGFIAGIALCNTAKGNYWFIQVSGIAQVKAATTQNASPAVGDLVYADYNGSTNNYYDPSQSAQPTNAQSKAVLGTVWANTAPGVIGPVMLRIPNYLPGGGGGEG